MRDAGKTIFYEKHVASAAKIVDFAGWKMPLNYPAGIVQEHLATRKSAGLFDVSHMGRFAFSGKGVLVFLQHVLSNNAAALDVGKSQYTIIPDERGTAIDDAYLYRFFQDEYLLVVNAANRQKDWDYFQRALKDFKDVEMSDKSNELAMVSLQGPLSENILTGLTDFGSVPAPPRNSIAVVIIKGAEVLISRTGYTGELLCFELFINNKDALMIWDLLAEHGGQPVGLGARDTLRLEAGLPLYGHEFGLDNEQNRIPVFACSLAKFAVSFSSLKGAFVGREALEKQFKALEKIKHRDYSSIDDLPRIIRPAIMVGKGIARAGDRVFCGDKNIGYVTSGTMVPYWKRQAQEQATRLSDDYSMRAICLIMLDSEICETDTVDVEIRGKIMQAVIVNNFDME